MIFWYPTTSITSNKKMVPDKFQAISGAWYHVLIQEVVKESPPPQEKPQNIPDAAESKAIFWPPCL